MSIHLTLHGGNSITPDTSVHRRSLVRSPCDTAATILWPTQTLLVTRFPIRLGGITGMLIDDVVHVNSISIVALYCC